MCNTRRQSHMVGRTATADENQGTQVRVCTANKALHLPPLRCLLEESFALRRCSNSSSVRQLLTAGDTLKNYNCEWNFYFRHCECPTFCLDMGEGGWVALVGIVFFSLFFCLQGPKMCIPLAEEFFCSDKLTMSVSHNATVWNILWGAAAGTQVLHAIGVTQCDSSCFLSFWAQERGGGRVVVVGGIGRGGV